MPVVAERATALADKRMSLVLATLGGMFEAPGVFDTVLIPTEPRVV